MLLVAVKEPKERWRGVGMGKMGIERLKREEKKRRGGKKDGERRGVKEEAGEGEKAAGGGRS